jgi:enoyl-CoA hydratase/carnithine racemase
MENYKYLLIERQEKVGIIQLNRPERRNALNVPMMTEIVNALKELDSDNQIGAAVISSAVPGIFCAGGDLTESVYPDLARQWQRNDHLAHLWLAFNSVGIIVISAVNGIALGGGTGIVACSDLAIASEDAQFGFPEIGLNSFPSTISPRLVRQCIGIRKCWEYILTGERFDASEAERLGLINKVVPGETLKETTINLARKIADKNCFAMRAGKRYFNSIQEMSYAEAVNYSVEFLTIVNSGKESIEAKKAFLNRKKQ